MYSYGGRFRVLYVFSVRIKKANVIEGADSVTNVKVGNKLTKR